MTLLQRLAPGMRTRAPLLALIGTSLVAVFLALLAHKGDSTDGFLTVEQLLEEPQTVSGKQYARAKDVVHAHEAVLVVKDSTSDNVAHVLQNVDAIQDECVRPDVPADVQAPLTPNTCPLTRFAAFGYAALTQCLAAHRKLDKPWRGVTNTTSAKLVPLDPNAWGLKQMPCAVASPALCFREGERLLPKSSGFQDLLQGGLALEVFELCETNDEGACESCSAHIARQLDDARASASCSEATYPSTDVLVENLFKWYVPTFAAYAHHVARPPVGKVLAALDDASLRQQLAIFARHQGGDRVATIVDYVNYAQQNAAASLLSTPAAAAALDSSTGGVAEPPLGMRVRICLQPNAPCCLAWDGLSLAPHPRLYFAPDETDGNATTTASAPPPAVLLRVPLRSKSIATMTLLNNATSTAIWLDLPLTVDKERQRVFEQHATAIGAMVTVFAIIAGALLAVLVSLRETANDCVTDGPLRTELSLSYAAAVGALHTALGIACMFAVLGLALMIERIHNATETILPALCIIGHVMALSGGCAGSAAAVGRFRHTSTPGGLVVSVDNMYAKFFRGILRFGHLSLAMILSLLAAASTGERTELARALAAIGCQAYGIYALLLSPLVSWMGSYGASGNLTRWADSVHSTIAGCFGLHRPTTVVRHSTPPRASDNQATNDDPEKASDVASSPQDPKCDVDEKEDQRHEEEDTKVVLTTTIVLTIILCAFSAVIGMVFCLDPAFSAIPVSPPLSAYAFANDDKRFLAQAMRAYEAHFGPHVRGAVIQATYLEDVHKRIEAIQAGNSSTRVELPQMPAKFEGAMPYMFVNPVSTEWAIRSSSSLELPNALSGQPSGLAYAFTCPHAIDELSMSLIAERKSTAAYHKAVRLGEGKGRFALDYDDDYDSKSSLELNNTWDALRTSFQYRRESLDALRWNAAYRGSLCGNVNAFSHDVAIATVNSNGDDDDDCGVQMLSKPDWTSHSTSADEVVPIDFRKGAAQAEDSCTTVSRAPAMFLASQDTLADGTLLTQSNPGHPLSPAHGAKDLADMLDKQALFWKSTGLYHARWMTTKSATFVTDVPLISDGRGARSLRESRERANAALSGDGFSVAMWRGEGWSFVARRTSWMLTSSPSQYGGPEPIRTLRDAALSVFLLLAACSIYSVVIPPEAACKSAFTTLLSITAASAVAALAAAACTMSACLRMGVLAYGGLGTAAPTLAAYHTFIFAYEALVSVCVRRVLLWDALCPMAICFSFYVLVLPLTLLPDVTSKAASWALGASTCMSLVWGVFMMLAVSQSARWRQSVRA